MANDYWQRRYLKDKAASVNRAEDYLAGYQKRLYSQAEQEIQEQIEKLYKRFASVEQISLAEAKRRVSDADFRRIDWNAMLGKSNDLLRQMKEDLPESVSENLEKQHQALDQTMKAYAKRGRISYLELRSMEIDRIMLSLYDSQQQDIYDFLQSEYDDGYYRSIYNTQQRMGFGYDFTRPNEKAVNTAILNRYDKRNFSRSLYAHCTNFSEDLKSNLVTGLITGESLDKMASRIHKRMGVAYSAAKTLVRTETAYIYETSTMAGYSSCGIELYEFLATLDYKTSEICQEMDGKHFKVKDAVPGKNFPPMHPNCRSTTVCWFPEEESKKTQTTRIAKNERGKYYEVPADMTYKEWKESLSVKIKSSKDDQEIQVIDISRKSSDEKIANILQDVYERRRIKDGLQVSVLDDMPETIKKMVFNVNIEGQDSEIQDKIVEQISHLTDRYKTTCYGIITVSKQEAMMNNKRLGWNVFDPKTYKSTIYLPPIKKEKLVERITESIATKNSVAVAPGDYLKYVITHEYGHTILNMKAGAKNWVKMDESLIKSAQKEIKEIFGEYKKTMLSLYTERDNLKERLNSPDIEIQWKAFSESTEIQKRIDEYFISDYAGGYVQVRKDGKVYTIEKDDPDEFLAESFAMHELGIRKSPYAERVAGVLEKYFGW